MPQVDDSSNFTLHRNMVIKQTYMEACAKQFILSYYYYVAQLLGI